MLTAVVAVDDAFTFAVGCMLAGFCGLAIVLVAMSALRQDGRGKDL